MLRNTLLLVYFTIMLQPFDITKGTKVKNQPLRVMGGRNVTKGEFPYVLRMQLEVVITKEYSIFFHGCTCSLLKPTWSLTAGHCIQQMEELLTIKQDPSYQLRGVIVNDKANSSAILSMLLHKNYRLKADRILNDIGLLNSEEIHVVEYGKISSVDYSTLYGHRSVTLGYGLSIGENNVHDTADKLNKSLQVLDIMGVPCDNLYVKPSFCMAGVCARWSAICPGDSGGPVVHPSGIIAVNSAVDQRNCHIKTSAMPDFKLRGQAGIVTPLSPFLDWISEIIK